MLVFGAPYLGDEEIQELTDCVKSGWIGTGPRVARFEDKFREYRKAQAAVAVNSCTAALHLSLLAANLEPGDEVITTPMTFCATVNAIIHADLKPVLVDIDPATQNIDVDAIEAAITPRTRALLPVHFAGRPCEMGKLMNIASRFELKVIEDCAHATEATFGGKSVGTFGDFGCFSFYVTKNMTTGEGGMVLCKSAEAQARVRTLALHGLTRDAWHRFGDQGYKHYDVVECGFKYNMTDMQAALGLHQLSRVESNWSRRQEIWNAYSSAFADLPVVVPSPEHKESRHAYHLYTLLINEKSCGVTRDEFVRGMQRRNIGVGVHYLSIPEHPYYQARFGWKPEQFPAAMRIGRQTVSIPLAANLDASDVADVADAVRGSLVS